MSETDIYVFDTLTVTDIVESLSDGVEVVDIEGNKVEEDAPLATGMKIVITEGDKIVDEKVVVVPFDVDGEAGNTAADARLALRQSVGLENLADYQLAAADVDNTSKDKVVDSADARLILRASVGLEDREQWFKTTL